MSNCYVKFCQWKGLSFNHARCMREEGALTIIILNIRLCACDIVCILWLLIYCIAANMVCQRYLPAKRVAELNLDVFHCIPGILHIDWGTH
jgi:hypothetical protein